MYKSAKAIQGKLQQAKYIYKQISKFKGRVFINNGVDKDMGVSPLIVLLSSFLACTRSVLQYARKEAMESGKTTEYEHRIAERPIFRFFKQLRDSDIHNYTIGSHTIISTEVQITSSDDERGAYTTDWVSFMVEDPSELDSPNSHKSQATITATLSKRIDITDELVRQLEIEGRHELVEAAKNGEELYEGQEFDGEKDLYKLCERYLTELEDFIAIGSADGFIS